ncbi:arginine deiminase-related protein [Nannocystis sp.]|uniref:arginine deiminase-related protein n=1 Tax=Nannocystis sp. TaxID=1962667 RepID=UPI003450EEA7
MLPDRLAAPCSDPGAAVERHTTLPPVAIPTIEAVGGGSARCMLAELFLRAALSHTANPRTLRTFRTRDPCEHGHADRPLTPSSSPMSKLSKAPINLVALLHLVFPSSRCSCGRVSRSRAASAPLPAFAAQSAVLAMNQGLYNGFSAPACQVADARRRRARPRQRPLLLACGSSPACLAGHG